MWGKTTSQYGGKITSRTIHVMFGRYLLITVLRLQMHYIFWWCVFWVCRTLEVPECCNGVARFCFEYLCGRPVWCLFFSSQYFVYSYYLLVHESWRKITILIHGKMRDSFISYSNSQNWNMLTDISQYIPHILKTILKKSMKHNETNAKMNFRCSYCLDIIISQI